MLTIVVYVLVTLVVAAALYGLSVKVFGRSELLPAVAKGHTVTWLPEGPLAGRDLRSVRFGMSPRGYTMAEVDWALEQAAAEIDRLRERLGEDVDDGGGEDAGPGDGEGRRGPTDGTEPSRPARRRATR